MQRFLKSVWADPVWSKVIATAISAIAASSVAMVWTYVNAGQRILAGSVFIGVLAIELPALYVYFTRAHRIVLPDNGPPVHRFKRSQRKLAGLTALLTPVICTAGILGWEFIRCTSNNQVTILVVDFESDAGLNSYRMTHSIFDHLRTALSSYPDTKVELLGRPVDWRKGIQTSLGECERRRADVVVWGDFDRTPEVVGVSMHFDVLRQSSDNLSSQTRDARYALGDLDRFVIQDQISSQFAYAGLLMSALARYRLGDYDSAIPRLTEALNESGNSNPNPAYFYRARSLYNLGKYGEAVDDYTRIIETDETFPHALNNRGASRIASGDFVGAVLDLTRAISLTPTESMAYVNRGGAFYGLRKYPEALADYESAINYSPKDPLALVGRANVKDKLGKFQDAVEDYNRALQLNSREPDTYFNRGAAFFRHGDLDKAVTDFSRAIVLRPDDIEALRGRAISYAKMGRIEAAANDYKTAIGAVLDPGRREQLEEELEGLGTLPPP